MDGLKSRNNDLLEARSQRRTTASRVTDGAGSVVVRAQWALAEIGRG
jgi:hypothetical protein